MDSAVAANWTDLQTSLAAFHGKGKKTLHIAMPRPLPARYPVSVLVLKRNSLWPKTVFSFKRDCVSVLALPAQAAGTAARVAIRLKNFRACSAPAKFPQRNHGPQSHWRPANPITPTGLLESHFAEELENRWCCNQSIVNISRIDWRHHCNRFAQHWPGLEFSLSHCRFSINSLSF